MKFRKFLAFLLSAFVVAPALAQPVPPTCDPTIKGVIDARAWMGGKRDMESAQSLITMAPGGSVLEISCFDTELARLGQEADRLFSDNYSGFKGGAFVALDIYEPNFFSAPYPEPPGGAFTPLKLDNTLGFFVRQTLRAHLSNYYTTPLPPPPAVICNNMARVWQISKCGDFNKAGFITLADHVTNDRRGCPVTTRATWRTKYAAGNPVPRPRSPAPQPVPPGGLDQMLSYLPSLYPPGCGSVIPAPTGLVYPGAREKLNEDGDIIYNDEGGIVYEGVLFEDAVCPGVGCWYDPKNKTCN